MPAEFAAFGRSWLSHHPGWTLLEWNRPEQIQPLVNQSLVPAARNVSQLSDLLRYEILSLFGGVYLDTDFECFKNIEPLLEDARFVGAGEYEDMLSAGFIAAAPRHPLITEILETIPSRMAWTTNQARATGPGLITDVWRRRKQLHDDGVVTYGPRLFYPYGWKEKHRRHEAFPEAYAAHHWAGSWL